MGRKSSSIKQSRFLTKDDCDPPVTVTIREVKDENVSADGQPEKVKPVVYFEEVDKGFVVNWTNAQLIDLIAGGNDIDEDWPGTRIVLTNDPTIQFQGKLVGGIRVQAPKLAKKKKPPAPAAEDPDDEIPFGNEDEDAAA